MAKRPSPWPALTVLLVVATAAAIGFLVVRSRERQQANAKWEAVRAELVAAGEPVSFADVVARLPVIPPEQNGALVIERLIPQLEELCHAQLAGVLLFDEDMKDIDLFTGIPAEAVEPMRAFVEEHQATLDELEELRNYRDGRLTIVAYDAVDKDPSGSLVPSLCSWRVAAKLECLSALSHLLDGDAGDAAEAIDLQFRTAATLWHEPNLIVKIVQLAIQGNAVRALEVVLRAGELDIDRLAALASILDTQLESLSPKDSLRADRAWFICACDGMASGKVKLKDLFVELPDDPKLRFVSLRDIREAQVTAANLLTQAIDVPEGPREFLQAAVAFDSVVSPASGLWRRQPLVARLLPPVRGFAQLTAEAHAELQCAKAALAAERYRLQHGQLPTSLAELVPDYLEAVPIDPFSSQPMLLIATECGITIYSVGVNQADDGGDLTTPAGKREPRDVGFRLLDVAHRGSIIADPASPEPAPPEPTP